MWSSKGNCNPKIAVLILFLIAVSAGVNAQNKCGRTNSMNLVVLGGTISPLYYPWMVSITDKAGKPYCGGTLIRLGTAHASILTAAHCVEGKSPSDIKLILGVHDLSKAISSDYYEVGSVERHPDYVNSGSTYENDLAILTTTVEIPDQPNISPICLFQGYGEFSEGRRTVLGWGKTDNGMAQRLQELTLRLIPTDQCGRTWERTFNPDKTLCMGQPMRNVCAGDDGGPLMLQNDNGFDYELKGVVSYYGPRCGDQFPAVYVNVEGYKTWIESNSL